MSVKGSPNQLRYILRSSPGKVLRGLEGFLNGKNATPQTCEPVMMTKLHLVAKQILSKPHLCEESMQDGATLLQTVQHLANSDNAESTTGVLTLMENGLMLMIKFFVSALHLLRDGLDATAELFYEDILETIGTLAESSTKAKCMVVEKFCDRLLQIVVSKNFSFKTRMESLRTVNMILERCPLQNRETLKSSQSHCELMFNMAVTMPAAGDYELQVGMTECLFRLTHTGDRPEFAKKWFADEEFLTAFLQIRDSDFENDCRKFLMVLNDMDVEQARLLDGYQFLSQIICYC